MLEISVGGDVYGLDDATAAELIERVELATAPLAGREPEPTTTLYKLRTADEAQASPELDDGDLALVGVVLEAWFQETDGDVPGDAQELQLAIARHLD